MLDGWASLMQNRARQRGGVREGTENKAHYFDSVSVLHWANENHFVSLYPACLTTYSGSCYAELMGYITDRDK